MEAFPTQTVEEKGIAAGGKVKQWPVWHDEKLDVHTVPVEVNAELSDWSQVPREQVVVAVQLHTVVEEGEAFVRKVGCTHVVAGAEEVDTMKSVHTCHHQEETDDLKAA